VTNKWIRFVERSLAVTMLATAVVGTAHAGKRTAAPVVVNSTNRSASGSVGSARNSSDSNQWISCQTSTSLTSHVITCSAADSTGRSASCSMPGDDTHFKLLGLSSMTESSMITFTWDAIGNCTSVLISTYSDYVPKAL
jgi:hypothetical protein